MRKHVFCSRDDEIFLAGRSLRSLGDEASLLCDREALISALATTQESTLLLRAGAWFRSPVLPDFRRSKTGKPLLAIGAMEDDTSWQQCWAETGGILSGKIPETAAIYIEPETAHHLANALVTGLDWHSAIEQVVNDPSIRSVLHHSLTYLTSKSLRILQVVTTIQIGGAERVTLDLTHSLRNRGHTVWVAALGKPTRRAFPQPRGFVDLSQAPRTADARAAAIAQLALKLKVDVIHAHLISGPEAEALYAQGTPVVITMHNMPQSWPRGFEAPVKKADLLIACSKTVAERVARAELGSPVRTAWNGIAAGAYSSTPERLALATEWRTKQGWQTSDFVVISVANPRQQKRLDRIPEILHRLQKLMPDRKVRGIIAGEKSHGNLDANEAQIALDDAIAQWGMDVLQTGAQGDVRLLLAASDLFLSTSSFEGLSLAQLEALAAGVPVVATDVGGAREIAGEMAPADKEYYHLLPPEASAETFAQAIVNRPSKTDRSLLPLAFTREKMATRVEQLYFTALGAKVRGSTCSSGIWLVLNNFSMGGAQSSARRLLIELRARGFAVRAFTVEEAVTSPTAGTQALRNAGIEVTAISPDYLRFPTQAAQEIIAAASTGTPQAILFWNLITSYKILLADGLPGIPIIDVSPGEMYFRSLDRYFANPRAEHPCRTAREYGALLSAAVVKYSKEVPLAEQALGCRVEAIPNGVPLPSPRVGRVKQKKLVFGTAARISPDKRLEDLITAFAMAHPQLPEYELRIAGRVERGAEQYAKELRLHAAELPVKWLGELACSQDFLSELDVFVVISEPAGCPNASLEALAAGLPVIATDVGGASEQVIDMQTGLLVPPRDPAAFASAIIQLADQPELRHRLGAAGRIHAETAFSMERMVTSYLRLCLEDQLRNPEWQQS
jgi:glycosyltransferase involved in cell wall biosynthesis